MGRRPGGVPCTRSHARRPALKPTGCDSEGVAAKQMLLDMAPLYQDKKTFASFLLDETACDKIGSILVNDVPQCQNGSGNEVDCIDLLEVSSRGEVPLER